MTTNPPAVASGAPRWPGPDAGAAPVPAPAPTPDLPDRALPFLLGYVRRRPWQFAVLAAIIVGGASCSVGVQYGMKLIIDAMAEGNHRAGEVWRWLALFIGLIALESALWRLGGWLGCRTVVATGVDLRLDLFARLTRHPMRFFADQMSGALGSRVTQTAGAAAGLFGIAIWHVLPPIVDFLGAVVVLVSVDPRMALALLGFVAIVGTLITRFGRRGRPHHQAYAEQASRVGGELVDVMANIWTVKAFSARQREYERLQREFGLEARAHRKSWLHMEKTRVLHDICLWLMAGGMLYWSIRAWTVGAGTAGDVVVISALTFRILHGSRDLALSLVDASQHLGLIDETLRLVARPQPVADVPGASPLQAPAGDIRLQGVHFTYEGGQPVFQGLDLHIGAGQRVGIVGPSGAGKSTLVGLLQRLEDVQAGRILVDGQDIAFVQQDSLRQAIGVVPQEIALLHRSVRENIRYGRPDADDAAVEAAARAAHCDDFIRGLPEGYDSLVGERGARLSGGQRQRIGIARAFLKDAPILLLDEATSALDSESERAIQAALGRLMHGRTVIAVAHRLATVATFDRVVVIVQGRVVEDGPPERLRQAGGLYARLWALQAQGLETE
ncbi:ABC transporter ATP-binding protein [Aquabacterium sp. J223]|uniref:ABC transporter ATP-binding protein n=1 Tax=Aquabacterium sp. J223 TaxID=2898431 RepID=UPI0021AD579F|nr:ABC transporter ATP-binding protein [Aquabacterium sp. J223]UUX96997.1 ABC transporter ATP-binding protein/permease [Aquabacterium sp. J223]